MCRAEAAASSDGQPVFGEIEVDTLKKIIPLGSNEVILNVNNETSKKCDSIEEDCVPLLQKLVAEVLGTYFLIFAGCASVVVNLNNDKVVTLPGIAIVWGLAVMVLVYSIGHISGAHFNPAVTVAHATTKSFPVKQGQRKRMKS
ncbi:aquaporin NIP1-2-like [Lotus japonicus]|uniref:aquaporin NIP1-2-like n=1 Tax=Lotus japonicus TaxID=34305 RepID=UPI002586E18F|nr:aquaporin NIP1-2-like [Lotus japonicus]